MKKVLSIVSLIAMAMIANAQTFTLTHEGNAVAEGSEITLTTSSKANPAFEDALLDLVLVNTDSEDGHWTLMTETPAGNTFSVSAVCGNMCQLNVTQANVDVEAGATKTLSVHFAIPSTALSGTSEGFTVKLHNRTTDADVLTFHVTLTYATPLSFYLDCAGHAVNEGSNINVETHSKDDPAFDDAHVELWLHNISVNDGAWNIITSAPSSNTFTVSSVCGNNCSVGTESNVDVASGAMKSISIHFDVPETVVSGTTESFEVKIHNRTTDVDDMTFTVTVTYTSSASIDEAVVANVSRVYPNPAVSNVTVEYAVEGTAQFVMVDVAGREVMQQYVSGNGSMNLNVENLHKGVYLYGIRQGNKSFGMKKLVVK